MYLSIYSICVSTLQFYFLCTIFNPYVHINIHWSVDGSYEQYAQTAEILQHNTNTYASSMWNICCLFSFDFFFVTFVVVVVVPHCCIQIVKLFIKQRNNINLINIWMVNLYMQCDIPNKMRRKKGTIFAF